MGQSRSHISDSLEAVFRAAFPHLILVLTCVGLYARSYWMLLPSLMMFAVVPGLDYLLGEHKAVVEKDRISGSLRKILSLSPVLYILFFFFCLLWLLAIIRELSLMELSFTFVSLACAGGVVSAAGHELIHRRGWLRSHIGEFPFIAFGYWHFPLAHIRNHHAHVATEHDNHAPAKNTSYWSYLIDSYPKSYAESSRIVNERMKNRKIPQYSLKNPYLWYFSIPAIMLVISFLLGGILGLAAYITVGIISILFSETAFYLEHYGLNRELDEQIAAEHSWDSYHRISNYQTFMVQRHADHHLNAGSEYVYLRPHDSSHRLPLGYPLLSLLAFFPAPFFTVMNKRIKVEAQL